MRLIYLFLLISFSFSCSNLKRKPKDIVLDKVVMMPAMAQDVHDCMVPRWQNELFDSGAEVPFSVTIHHITGSVIDKYLMNMDSFDNALLAKINGHFKEVGFVFSLKESINYTDELLINNFVSDSESFEDRNTLNIVVYHYRDPNEMINGVALRSPGSILGINLNVTNINTIAHELGHCFGLPHIFEKDDTDGKNISDGDKICDTPAYSLMDNRNVIDCGWKGQPMYSEEDLQKIIPNFLNYNSGLNECRNYFSVGQIMVMRWYVENTPVLKDAIIIQ